ncbi:MAG: response regulator, partial [Candidatus Neomarinimicrobiota bacterium]
MGHVLLVEDDKLNTIIFTKLLERRGKFQVTHSEDPATILNLCGSGTIDLVVMDISLNKSKYEGKFIDGIEITRLLKNQPESATIPVILTTAHAMAGDKERYLKEAGAEAYVTKPVTDHEGFVETV